MHAPEPGEQCCQGEGALACGPIGNLNQGQCCRPLGGACSTGSRFDECCTVVGSPDSFRVFCAANNTCGGPGVRCAGTCGCWTG